jgi:hypothetical protein
MKRKIVNLTLSLILIFTLAAIVAPAGAAPVAAAGYGDGVYGGYGSYTLADYDVRYVSIDRLGDAADGYNKGSNSYVGSEKYPWLTLTYAETQLPWDLDPDPLVDKPDMIIVGPGEYGGENDPEKIVIFYDNNVSWQTLPEPSELVIVSLEGAEETIINVSEQFVWPDFVIEIYESNVTIDDFTLTGSAYGGILAEPDIYIVQDTYIENVKVLNNIIKLDEIPDGCQIRVGTGGADLDLGLLSVQFARGIVMADCFTAQITNNELDVWGDYVATGIAMSYCPKSLVGVLPDGSVATNDIEVKAAGDVVGTGITVDNSDLIDIKYNDVQVLADGSWWTIGNGILVAFSHRIEVYDNNVAVHAEVDDGLLQVLGINLFVCHESEVELNYVTITTEGVITEAAILLEELNEGLVDALEDLESVLAPSLGIESFVRGWGMATGIGVHGSFMTSVLTNNVNVDLDVSISAGDEMYSDAAGGGYATGISCFGSPVINVDGNTVNVHDLVDLQSTSVDFYATGNSLSVALGINLLGSPGWVTDNDVNADADLMTDIESSEALAMTMDDTSALAQVNSQILGAIYDSLYDTLESEDINVELSGDLSGIQAWGTGGGTSAGIGILVMDSWVVEINGNTLTSGTGDVLAMITAYEQLGDDFDPPAWASGNGLGLGGGIVVLNTYPKSVSGNANVIGAGSANVSVGAYYGVSPLYADADAAGMGTSLGFGILLFNPFGIFGEVDTEELPSSLQMPPMGPIVSTNTVTASAITDNVSINADSFSPSAMASGTALAAALGITALGYNGILIDDNIVDATGNAIADIDAAALTVFDPSAMGGAVGIGAGITTVSCEGAQILDNPHAKGVGKAYAEIGAVEELPSVTDSGAFGGSLGLGEGILVINSPNGLVSGNSNGEEQEGPYLGAIGLGDAECNVIAESSVPLNWAVASSLATGIGNGIGVVFSAYTDVLDCNTAAGEGTTRVYAEYDADFGFEVPAGFAGSFDIVMASGPPGDINFNSMVDATPAGYTQSAPYVLELDAGLLTIFCCPDARYNWWNDPTGPSGLGPGNGEAFIGCGEFSPWLYVEHRQVLEEQVGKFGFYLPLCKGLNAVSTPIALEQSDDVVSPASREWGDVFANSDLVSDVNVLLFNRWDTQTQQWIGVAPTDYFDPLDAYYMYLAYPTSLILYVNSSVDHPYAMPVRGTVQTADNPNPMTEGWVLFGPNPQFDDHWMPVEVALSSVEQTYDGKPGYTQCITPNVWCQDRWIFTPNMLPDESYDLESGKGYWLWMLNAIDLVGFGFSPLPAGP